MPTVDHPLLRDEAQRARLGHAPGTHSSSVFDPGPTVRSVSESCTLACTVKQARVETSGPSRFGVLLHGHRAAAGLSQAELAERAGVSARAVSDLERGVRRFPYRETGRRLADALGLEGQQRANFHTGPRLERLVQRGITADRRLPPLVSPSQLPLRHALPNELSSFIGRQSELGELRKLLSGTRSLTLTGSGGIGKTRLALRVWRAQPPRTMRAKWCSWSSAPLPTGRCYRAQLPRRSDYVNGRANRTWPS
jgi:transcriptional regulator with XRE-family HTH domain